MKKYLKRILLILGLILLLLQFYQPARNNSYEQVTPMNIANIYNIPEDVQNMLRTSCYDCHSNNTQYPWYSYIQPPRLIMENHIKKGKADLNFSEFGSYSKRKMENKLDRIVKQINADEMPLASYTMIHKDAILNTTQKEQIIIWINSTKNNNE